MSSVGRAGGLALLWMNDVKLEIISFSDSHIDTNIDGGLDNFPWRFTGVYGQPEVHRRILSWNLPRQLKENANIAIGNFADLSGQFKECGESLTKWNREKFGNIRIAIEKKQRELEGCYEQLASRSGVERLLSCRKDLEDLLSREEAMWPQRAKSRWLTEGDRNTRYFHATATRRRQNNHISRILDEGGIGRMMRMISRRSCMFSHVKRNANRLAHELTRVQMDSECETFWYGGMPPNLCNPDDC
ncbi:hypothetical protein DITRI_Ditri11bG0019900 [Diplodiscus trichospermus]